MTGPAHVPEVTGEALVAAVLGPDSPSWAPTAASEPVQAPSASRWAPVDLDALLAGQDEEQRHPVLTHTDGLALLYPGKVHTVVGEPE